jgi:hypothetical protein
MYCKYLSIIEINAFISYLNFIENKFLITSLYQHEMLNSVMSLQIMIFKTYNIDKLSLEHYI